MGDLIAFTLTIIGTLLPDIDHPKSTIGRKMLFVSYPIRIIFGHRGITHSLLAMILLAYGINQLNINFLNWLVVGYGFHLLGDFITPAGIPLFYPLKKCYSVPLIKTGAVTEFVFSVSCIAIVYLY